MKNIITLLTVLLLLNFATASAQETPLPLPDHSSNEFKPEAPTSQHVWVKGHYEYKSGKYYWINGAYVLGLENQTWVDGKWVLNESSNMYSYSPGYWKQELENITHNGIVYEPGVVTKLSVVEMYDPTLYSASAE